MSYISLVARFDLVIFLLNVDGQDVLLGSFSTRQHQVSGEVYAVDQKTIRIENFRYDGAGVGQ